MGFQLIHIFTVCMLIIWLMQMGTLKWSRMFFVYDNSLNADHLFGYNIFRLKCRAISRCQSKARNALTEAGEEEIRDEAGQVKNLQKICATEGFEEWQEKGNSGYSYRNCLGKSLNECKYPYWDMWWTSTLMGVLQIIGILSIFFNISLIEDIFQIVPLFFIIFSIADRAKDMGILTKEKNMPIFAILIVVAVSMYWVALAKRYKEDCQGVIDSSEEVYDEIPTYILLVSVGMLLLQFIRDKRALKKRRQARQAAAKEALTKEVVATVAHPSKHTLKQTTP